MDKAQAGKLRLSILPVAVAWMVVGAAVAQGQTIDGKPIPSAASNSAAATASDLTFDVASVRPSEPVDMTKVAADMQAGKMPNWGVHLNGLRAEYNYQRLKELIVVAYKVKDYQITGPDWMNKTDAQRFDIAARMPEGTSKDDAPKMLQALLAERFKLKVHRETQEHPVMALVVGKGGPKMKESPGDAPPLDLDVPLKAGEMQVDTPDGPARMTMDKSGMGGTMNMGAKGIITYSVDIKTMMLHMTSTKTTMAALADMLTQMMTSMGGAAGGSSRPVLDMTGLKGNYEVALDFSLADMIAQARAQAGMGGGGGATSGSAAPEALDPGGGGATVSDAVEKLGLKLESRKAPVEQLVVDSAEKMPTEN
ncbi:MAG: TIGR03435 family protein [Acidobacteriaceae bacterium]